MRATLTPELVHQIRTTGLSDTHWARRLDVPVRTIRDARIGNTWPHIATPPDIRNPSAQAPLLFRRFPATTKGSIP